MVEEHVIDLIPSYALGALNKAESEQVVEHIKNCQACQEELESYARIVDDLPLAVKTTQPPTSLKRRIMSKVREDRQSEFAPYRGQFWEKIRSVFILRSPAWGAVSIVLVLVLFASNLFLWQRLNVLERTSHNALITVELQGTEFRPEAAGMLVMSDDGDYGVLIVDGLPRLDNTKQYQLWLISDGEKANGGVFSVNQEGYGNLLVASSKPLTEYSTFGITVEPEGGSPGPTGVKVLGG